MSLPLHEHRCTVGTEHAPCAERATCQRYTDRHVLGRWTPVTFRLCERAERKIEVAA